MKKPYCLIGIALAAIMTGADETAMDNVTARIESCSASVKKPSRGANGIYVSYKYSFITTLPRVKKPVLTIICCYEKNDGVRYRYEGYMTPEGRSIYNVKTSIEASKLQTEVASSPLRHVAVNNKLFFNFGGNKKFSVVAARMELWFDGKMLCNNRPQGNLKLSKLHLPEDWYLKDKYPDKMKYID